MRVVGRELGFPEGPVSEPDGSVVVVEIQTGDLTRVHPGGEKTTVAHCGGGPNGAARGPDGNYIVANNGGLSWRTKREILAPIGRADDYAAGYVQRVDVETGRVDVMYEACDGSTLNAPNDLVLDAHGGFYFTDTGTTHAGRIDEGYVYYAATDGSSIRRVAAGLDRPNGVALSPGGSRLYVAESMTARVWYWDLDGPGVLKRGRTPFAPSGATLLYGFDEFLYIDSIAVDSEGSVCIGTLKKGGITRVSEAGERQNFFEVPLHDPFVTNICFDVRDRRTAYVTSSGRGLLYALEWPCDGLKLAVEGD